MPDTTPGAVLRAERLRRGLTLAQAGQLVGYSPSALSRIEHGRPLDTTTLRRLAVRYDLAPERLGLATVEPSDLLEGGDGVLRRELLAGVLGVAGASLLGEPEALAGPTTAPATIHRLRHLVDQMQADYLACRYSRLAAALPDAVRHAHATRDAMPTHRHDEVDALTSTTYRHATWLALQLGEDGLATGLSDQAIALARASGDLRVEAEAAQIGAVVLRHFRRSDEAQRLVVDTATRLDTNTKLTRPDDSAAYAILLEAGAYTAATAGNRDTALDLHTEATRASRTSTPLVARTAATAEARYLALYEISVHRTLGDYGTAIHAARAIPPHTITVTERRLRYWQDVALAFGAWGKPDKALHALLAAERVAPHEVRLRPWAHRLARELRTTGRPLPGLREFTARAHIT